ncbi:MAG: hypothetical protein K5929_05110 [Lachnospiraceae bacterium]|nr:hypothetical protein [Lachnospiraceae bacterium]
MNCYDKKKFLKNMIRLMFRSWAILFAALIFIISQSVDASAAPALSEKKIKVMQGCAYVIYVDDNSDEKEVLWDVVDPAKVEIVYSDDQYAVLKALQKGKTRVTAKIGKKKMTCTVKVTKAVSFPKKMMVMKGDTFELSAGGKSAWNISDAYVKAVSPKKKVKKQKFKAKSAGSVTITAQRGRTEKKCEVTVLSKKGLAYDLRPEMSEVEITEGENCHIGVETKSTDRNADVRLTSGNECAVGTVLNNGILVYGVQKGDCVITLQYGTVVKEIHVTVKEKPFYSLRLSSALVMATVGDTVKVKSETESNDDSAKLQVSCDDTGIAEAKINKNEIVIKAKKDGVATLSVSFGTEKRELPVIVLLKQEQSLIANVKGINHRGFCGGAPENTLPAYRLSKQMGFDYAEADITFTKDGVPVLLHDNTINRTARNKDGSIIKQTIYIKDITYQQALEYDFGVFAGSAYKGTTIPTFVEFIRLCRDLGIHPYIELKSDQVYTDEQIDMLLEIVRRNGMEKKVTWISFEKSYLISISTKDPSIRIGYLVGTVTDEVIGYAQSMKTTDNEVFIDTSDYSANAVSLCYNAHLPMEVWTIDDPEVMKKLDPYITGVTSNTLNYATVLKEAQLNR